MRKLLSFLSFPFLLALDLPGQDEPSSPPSVQPDKTISKVRGMPEEFFPELREILIHLEENSPVLKVERERENEALARKLVIDGKQTWRGGLGVEAYSFHENRDNGNYHHRYRFLASADARRPLYHWGALHAESRIAELGVKTVRSEYAETYRKIATNSRSSYLELVLHGYALNLAKESLSLAKENEDTAKRKRDLGLVTDLDLTETKIASLRQRIRIFELERDMQSEKRIFAHETGHRGELSFTIPENFRRFVSGFASERPTVPVRSALHSGLLDSLTHAIEIEGERVIVAEAIRKPKVNLAGSIYQDQVDALDSTQTLDRTNLLLGVQVRWDIFDGHESEGRKSEALSRKRRLQMQKEYEKQRLVLHRDRLLHDLETRADLVQSRKELEAVSKEKVEKGRIEFEQNRITVEDFFAFRLDLDQSRLELMRAVVDYLGLLGEYLVLQGEGVSRR
jgi:outer membrane protein TolC